MRTHFSPAQLADPVLADAEQNLRTCVHCGMCTATCPTYLVTGDERDSPRGRIVMIQHLLEAGDPPDAETVHHLDRCLTCLSCRTTCPSGVDYRRLIEAARIRIEESGARPLGDRLLRRFVSEVLTRPAALRAGQAMARLFAPVAKALPGRWGVLAAKGAVSFPPRVKLPEPQDGVRRVALMPGCVSAALAPQIDAAAVRVLGRRGIALVPLAKAGCCGALPFHLGQQEAAKAWARQAIAAFEASGCEAVLITATGCGAHLADYGHLLRDEPEWSARATSFSARCVDLSTLVTPRAVVPPHRLRIALHRPCSLTHGLRLATGGATQLAAAGHTVLETAEPHICCGSAGSYSLLQPDLSGALRSRKRAVLTAVAADAVASSNIGCIEHLTESGAPPVLHWVELLDWSEGGAVPAALSLTAKGS